MQVRPLPVIQNWDCGGCADCCRTYQVPVTPEEKAKIDAQGWDVEVVGRDPKTGEFRLNHTPDGACVMLGPDNRCRIHAKHGPDAKPRACRIYPFVMVPAGDHWRVGLRFACPAAAANTGRPANTHAADLAKYAKLLEADGDPASKPAPPFGGSPTTWPDLLRAVAEVEALLANAGVPVERRVRQVIGFVGVCRRSRLDKLAGPRLGEFFELMAAAVADETPVDPADVPPPPWTARMTFRQVAAIYSRKDNGPDAGVGRAGKLTRVRAAWGFALGSGRVPKLHAKVPDVTFAAAEQPRGPLPPDADALLTRYLRLKVGSVQFCGPPNFGLPFWDGLETLLLTFPVILWLARVFSGEGSGPLPPRTVELAVRAVDDNFGFNPLLGSARQAWAVRSLADRGDLVRLAAWYGR